MNLFLLLCEVFSFVFWKKLKTSNFGVQKGISKLSDLQLVKSKYSKDGISRRCTVFSKSQNALKAGTLCSWSRAEIQIHVQSNQYFINPPIFFPQCKKGQLLEGVKQSGKTIDIIYGQPQAVHADFLSSGSKFLSGKRKDNTRQTLRQSSQRKYKKVIFQVYPYPFIVWFINNGVNRHQTLAGNQFGICCCKKVQISGISSPRLSLCRAGNTANV